MRVLHARYLIAILAALLLTATIGANAAAAEGAKKKAHPPAKRANKKSPAAEVQKPATPEQDRQTALSSCKQHVESMLKESAEHRFQSDDQLKIEHPDAAAFDISGWVTTEGKGGAVQRTDFICHAAHSAGGLWTTKTSLIRDK